jgi:hypothetical protein
MRIVIVGNGKMGRTVAALAGAKGHEVQTIGRAENIGGRALTRERLGGVQVALEFTAPEAAPTNLERLIEAGIPVVCGTTGWQAELPRIARLIEDRGALLHAANFSAGVHSSCGRRAHSPPSSPGGPASTALYWRSIMRPSWTRRRAPPAPSSPGSVTPTPTGAIRSPRSAPARFPELTW